MIKSFNYIKNTFLKLTSKTYPYGFEDILVDELVDLFPKIEEDEFGNYFYKIGNSETVFTSHLDTACRDYVRVISHIDSSKCVRTDGNTILGADDKAGVTLMLWLIQNNIPGLYYFFIGEEVGCIGSGKASALSKFKDYKRIVSFDRRGTSDVITHQSCVRTCSDEFAIELSSQLNRFCDLKYKKDDTGVYTDSAEFVRVIPECTNISVGYYNEHTVREYQDLIHLNKLAQALLTVNWEKLPTCRDVSKVENKWDDDYDFSYYKKSGTIISTANNNSKRNRRSNKKRNGSRPRIMKDAGNGVLERYNNLEKHIEYSISDNTISVGNFDTLREKLLSNPKITREDLMSLKDTLFDMTNPSDRIEYNYLESSVW